MGALGDAISTLAEAIGPHIRTLDALPLATALDIREPMTAVTCDTAMREVAAELGFLTFDPCGETA